MSTTLWNGSQQIMSEVSDDVKTLNKVVHPIRQLNVGEYSLTNFLDVNLTDSLDQKHEAIYFGTDDASTLTNSPVTTGQFYGYRTVAFMKREDDTLWLLKVTIHEILPNYGRCWTNVYSAGKSDWLGWKESGADSGFPFSSVIMPFYIYTNSVGVRQNQSALFCINTADKFKIITQSVSNYTNYKLYASRNEDMSEYITLASGQFGAEGAETIINNSDRYSYFKFEVGPGSSQYLSHVKFQVRA